MEHALADSLPDVLPEALPDVLPNAKADSETPAASSRRNGFCVLPEEAGQKLLHCLNRRLVDADEATLHRWIRTGQVRVNGGRKKAFDRISAGDEIRLPPFAVLQPGPQNSYETDSALAASPSSRPPLSRPPLGLEILSDTDSILALAKPVGLPVQPGTGHTDSVVSRLRAHYAGAPFMPAPAHRLDRDTSGVLLAGLSYEAQRALSEAFADHLVVKEYLAWCVGHWPHAEAVTLTDVIGKRENPSDARRRERSGRLDAEDGGKEASLTVRPLKRRTTASLLHIELHTGRTHQIRVQLALAGHPVAGDAKYGGRPALLAGTPWLLLHAFRLTLQHPKLPPRTVSASPPWTGPWFFNECVLL